MFSVHIYLIIIRKFLGLNFIFSTYGGLARVLIPYFINKAACCKDVGRKDKKGVVASCQEASTETKNPLLFRKVCMGSHFSVGVSVCRSCLFATNRSEHRWLLSERELHKPRHSMSQADELRHGPLENLRRNHSMVYY